jgi:hypothetical protein
VSAPTTAIKRNSNYNMADVEAITKLSLAVACVFTSDRHESSNFRDDSCLNIWFSKVYAKKRLQSTCAFV